MKKASEKRMLWSKMGKCWYVTIGESSTVAMITKSKSSKYPAKSFHTYSLLTDY